MIVEYINGDLFKTEYFYIAHGCNCKGVMGAGVAKQIKEKFPKSYNLYKNELKMKFSNSEISRLGDVISCRVENNHEIIHCLTQDDFGSGKQVSYWAIANCFKTMNQYLPGFPPSKKDIAIPKIGAGLAGGDWSIIEELINENSSNLNIHVYVKD